MRALFLIPIVFLVAFVAFAEEPKVYTNDDLGKYNKSESGRSNIRDEKLRSIMEEYDQRKLQNEKKAQERQDNRAALDAEIAKSKPIPMTAQEQAGYRATFTDMIRRTLKDPGSLNIYSFNVERRGPYTVLGIDYGAKNSFGGYVRAVRDLIFKGDEVLRDEERKF